ncbi:hypothetical protein SDC9_118434 [bioreactor metagenome]|uniref:Uncharacterized protein n=1 Tax=bioreactor metagenome TaxID=1076179 RepID=A0A645C1F9_9ZZZZ
MRIANPGPDNFGHPLLYWLVQSSGCNPVGINQWKLTVGGFQNGVVANNVLSDIFE